MASVKNLASGTLVSGINVGDTTLTVAVGSGTSEELLAVWPTPPFYITVAPDSPASGVSNALDSEIMSVTAVSYSSENIIMTVTRAQRGTTARSFNANAIVTNAVYAEDAVLLGPNGTTDSPSPWIQTEDILDDAITKSKLNSSVIAGIRTTYKSTSIPNGADLNTNTYIQPGVYISPDSVGVGSLTNCPVGVSFMLEVFNLRGGDTEIPATKTYVYLRRRITTITGEEWVQIVTSNGTPVWTYNDWKMVSAGNKDGYYATPFTLNDGYTLLDGLVFRFGPLVSANFVIKINSGSFPNDSATTIGTIASALRPWKNINAYGGAASSQWGAINSMAYIYIQTDGKVIVRPTSANQSFLKFNLSWSVA